MKFVLFLVFIETGFEKLAEYSDYETCTKDQAELEEAQKRNLAWQEATAVKYVSYACVAVPQSYNSSE